ncbi:MAG: DoxX family membrane protein [Rhizobacter sp.]|nr:DoxX family membrane protein [Ferruginibacter sp.]
MSYIKINAAYHNIRSKNWLNIAVILTRYLIGFAFIPSGLKKIMGVRFTQIPVDNPIGFFFEALYRSGMYWNFIGWAQVLAALLLMTQRFATLGAVFFFFIVSNIWVITISLGFTGTWVITSLMLLAVAMLLTWDFHKLKYIFYADNYTPQTKPVSYPTYNNTWVITGFILFTWSMAGLLLMESMHPSGKLLPGAWLAGILLIVLVGFYSDRKKTKK